MFVCLGNICRSPVAEAAFTHLVHENKLQKKFMADSSGTSAYHIGADPDPRMQATAEKNGVEMNHSAQQFKKEHFDKFDIIFAMDSSNYDDIVSLTQNQKLRKKVYMFRDFDPKAVSNGADVPDPYYRGGMEAFDEVFDIAYRTCEQILSKLKAKEL